MDFNNKFGTDCGMCAYRSCITPRICTMTTINMENLTNFLGFISSAIPMLQHLKFLLVMNVP
jgi:hypothetical protein